MRGRYHKWLKNNEKALKVIRRLKIKKKRKEKEER
jgi:hypothetical protein